MGITTEGSQINKHKEHGIFCCFVLERDIIMVIEKLEYI